MNSEHRDGARPGGARPRPALRWPFAAVIAAVATAAMLAGCSTPQPSRRDSYWRQDVAYLARQLPLVHVDGVTGTSKADWDAAASRLESQLPRLSNGQVIVGMARLVAMLRDDETQLAMPASAVYPFNAQWIGGQLYLIAVPSADRDLLGARLVAVDGHPIASVLGQLRDEVDYQDPGVADDWLINWDTLSPQFPGYLNNADLLNWLGLTRSAGKAAFTVQTVAGLERTVSLTAVSSSARFPRITSVPSPLYMQHPNLPYWMQTLPAERAVYIKYNQCLDNDGFQQLAARAMDVLAQHPGYRLIIDLRDNTGGDSAPFQSLVNDISADPALDQPGRVFGLINGFTDSSASLDAYDLKNLTQALLVGQQVASAIDEFGNDSGLLRLPHYGIEVSYTTAVINASGAAQGRPDIVVAPTLHDVLTGYDPVLEAALRYGRAS